MKCHLFALQIVEAMPHSDSVQTFIEKLGSFYEMVDTNTINSRSSKRNNNDVTKSLEALTEKPFGEGETECAALVGGTNTAQYVAFESTTKHTDLDASTGEGIQKITLHCNCWRQLIIFLPGSWYTNKVQMILRQYSLSRFFAH